MIFFDNARVKTFRSENSKGEKCESPYELNTTEYKEYADQIRELIRQYVPSERDMLEQAYQTGNIMVGPEPGASGQYRLLISNYIKQGDKMTQS